MDIAEVSKRSGVPASTLRFYEEKGLIHSVGRHGLRRLFNAAILDQLAVITLARTAGFALDEIATMFSPAGQLKIDRKRLVDKARQIDTSIVKLKAMSKGLKHASECPARNHLECPTFRRLMRAVSQGELVPDKKVSRKKP